jgi:hypothetical protein
MKNLLGAVAVDDGREPDGEFLEGDRTIAVRIEGLHHHVADQVEQGLVAVERLFIEIRATTPNRYQKEKAKRVRVAPA